MQLEFYVPVNYAHHMHAFTVIFSGKKILRVMQKDEQV